MRVLLVVGGVVVVIVVAFVVFVNVLPSGGVKLDCSEVAVPDAAAFQALGDEERQTRVRDLNGCKKLVGLSREELQAALGPPARTYGNAVVYEFATNGDRADGSPFPPDTTAFLLSGDGRVTGLETKEGGAPTN